MNQHERDVIVEVLCSQALADNPGDIRDAERKLWGLLGVRVPYRDEETAYRNTKATLKAHGIPLPSYLEDDGE